MQLKTKNSFNCTQSVAFYDTEADNIVDRYESVSFDEIHAQIIDLIPSQGSALDIGAGSGRDASALSERGLDVTAVEPSKELLKRAKIIHGSKKIKWTNDSLPELNKLPESVTFDFILISAVWMHINEAAEGKSARRCKELTKPNGIVALTLRNPPPNIPGVFHHNASHVCDIFENVGFLLTRHTTSNDTFNRKGVTWDALVFRA